VKIVTAGGNGYNVLGVVSVNTSFSTEELKSQWRLADTILIKDNEYYICETIINAEFSDFNA
jgi:hypothetical protein